jgi:sec-independent protein translocase protein TatB
MFGLGWGEMVVIGIVALIAIGPKELPTVLRTLGQSMAKIRRMAAEFQGQFQEALREVEISDLKKQAEDITSSVTDFSNFDPMANAQKEMERAFMPDAPATGELASAPSPDAANAALAAPAPPAELAAPLPEATPLPEINVPLPEPLTEKDFAPTELPPPKEPEKQAGGSA